MWCCWASPSAGRLLAVLSIRVSDRPQRWAAPAVFLTVAGLVALLGSDTVVGRGFRWVWPPLLLVLAVWSITRARRQMPRRARRWLVYPLLAGLALSAIGGGYETVRESIDAAAYPMPGQLVDVGGHRLHLSCTGSGTPTVVLEPGHGEVSSAMAWIAGEVARTAGSAYMTGPGEVGVIRPTVPKTPWRPPPTCTRC